MQVLSTLLYFIVTIGILVLVHELGHFLAAKLFKMRVDRFSIGFPPRAFGKQIGETDYCVSWLPIGGYVKIAGMIDESFDTDFLNRAPEPWEYRAKPIWQRMIVISAGVIMNFLLALLIFAGMNYSRGTILRETTTVGYVIDGSPAAHAGFQVGDRVTTVNTKPVSDWDGMIEQVYAGLITGDVTWSVVRAGTPVQLTMAHNAIPDPTQAPIGIVAEKTEIVISTVEPGKPADKLGLKPNDVLLAMSGTPVRYDLQVRELVHARAGQNLDIEWRRDGAIMRGTAVPTVDGKIGISFLAEFNGPVQRVRYGVFQSIGRSNRSRELYRTLPPTNLADRRRQDCIFTICRWADKDRPDGFAKCREWILELHWFCVHTQHQPGGSEYSSASSTRRRASALPDLGGDLPPRDTRQSETCRSTCRRVSPSCIHGFRALQRYRAFLICFSTTAKGIPQ